MKAILNKVFAGKYASSLIVWVKGEYPGENEMANISIDKKNIGAINPRSASIRYPNSDILSIPLKILKKQHYFMIKYVNNLK